MATYIGPGQEIVNEMKKERDAARAEIIMLKAQRNHWRDLSKSQSLVIIEIEQERKRLADENKDLKDEIKILRSLWVE